MHYKIASLILNASKHQTGSREVFIAQPDSQKESLAGKIFLMAEIGGKKSEAKAAIDFILDSIDRFYYQDEKIYLQDKVENLSLENIFEAAVAKINKALLEFLNSEKIFLQPEESSVILGLIFEDKLYFSNFGRNKAFLIYKQADEYELINVEASAADEIDEDHDDSNINPKFFSSVISGKVPPSSYFLFCNEVVMEYLSNKELINIITKLPPIAAVEQIKSSLAKLNSYVPFLGIIIKNTYGLSLTELKDEAQIEILKSAHNSISHLNSTEARTEQMLSPSGIFNWKKLANAYNRLVSNWQNFLTKKGKKVAPKQEIRSSLENLPKQKGASNLIKEKIFFGRSHSRSFKAFKVVWFTIVNIFNPIFWKRSFVSFKSWLSQLHPRNKAIFVGLVLIVIVLFVSLSLTRSNNRKKINDINFNETISALETKKSMLDSYLLYDNYDGAKTIIGEMIVALDELNFRNKEQEDIINNLRSDIIASKAQVQKLVTINEPEMLFDFKTYNSSAETRNIVVNNDSIYAADPLAKAVYIWNTQEKKSDSFLLSGDITSLDGPLLEGDQIYYLNDKSIFALDSKTGTQERFNITGFGEDDKINDFALYGNGLYLLSASNNQIYRLSKSADPYTNRSSWLKEDASLSDAVGIAVTGDIFVLKNNGSLEKFRIGKKEDFAFADVDPKLDSASLLKYFNNRLFILDRNSKRLLVFELDGNLKQQYKLPSLNNLKDFTISTDEAIAYILNDDAIYQIEL